MARGDRTLHPHRPVNRGDHAYFGVATDAPGDPPRPPGLSDLEVPSDGDTPITAGGRVIPVDGSGGGGEVLTGTQTTSRTIYVGDEDPSVEHAADLIAGDVWIDTTPFVPPDGASVPEFVTKVRNSINDGWVLNGLVALDENGLARQVVALEAGSAKMASYDVAGVEVSWVTVNETDVEVASTTVHLYGGNEAVNVGNGLVSFQADGGDNELVLGLDGALLHNDAAIGGPSSAKAFYAQDTDPGAIGMGGVWKDTAFDLWWQRNNDDDGWDARATISAADADEEASVATQATTTGTGNAIATRGATATGGGSAYAGTQASADSGEATADTTAASTSSAASNVNRAMAGGGLGSTANAGSMAESVDGAATVNNVATATGDGSAIVQNNAVAPLSAQSNGYATSTGLGGEAQIAHYATAAADGSSASNILSASLGASSISLALSVNPGGVSLKIFNLPTADPLDHDAFWLNNGVLTKSVGP